jgi:hypothetical protein
MGRTSCGNGRVFTAYVRGVFYSSGSTVRVVSSRCGSTDLRDISRFVVKPKSVYDGSQARRTKNACRLQPGCRGTFTLEGSGFRAFRGATSPCARKPPSLPSPPDPRSGSSARGRPTFPSAIRSARIWAVDGLMQQHVGMFERHSLELRAPACRRTTTIRGLLSSDAKCNIPPPI